MVEPPEGWQRGEEHTTAIVMYLTLAGMRSQTQHTPVTAVTGPVSPLSPPPTRTLWAKKP